MGRDRAVVDDAPALRPLALHEPERPRGAEEHAYEIDVDHLLPGAPGEPAEVCGGLVGACVGIPLVEPVEGAFDARDNPVNGIGIADVSANRQYYRPTRSE